MKPPTGIVGNTGLYYACYRLSALGWNVMPTARNTRGIDIVCFSVNGKTVRTIQVKSLTKADTVPLARIMREGAVEGETQEPPCGTNVMYTTF